VLFLAAACPLPLADEVWTAANGNSDDESRCVSLADPTDFKVLVFAVSAGAGIAGALYTLQSGSASPRAMDIAFSIENGDLGVEVALVCGGDTRSAAGELCQELSE